MISPDSHSNKHHHHLHSPDRQQQQQQQQQQQHTQQSIKLLTQIQKQLLKHPQLLSSKPQRGQSSLSTQKKQKSPQQQTQPSSQATSAASTTTNTLPLQYPQQQHAINSFMNTKIRWNALLSRFESPHTNSWLIPRSDKSFRKLSAAAATTQAAGVSQLSINPTNSNNNNTHKEIHTFMDLLERSSGDNITIDDSRIPGKCQNESQQTLIPRSSSSNSNQALQTKQIQFTSNSIHSHLNSNKIRVIRGSNSQSLHLDITAESIQPLSRSLLAQVRHSNGKNMKRSDERNCFVSGLLDQNMYSHSLSPHSHAYNLSYIEAACNKGRCFNQEQQDVIENEYLTSKASMKLCVENSCEMFYGDREFISPKYISTLSSRSPKVQHSAIVRMRRESDKDALNSSTIATSSQQLQNQHRNYEEQFEESDDEVNNNFFLKRQQKTSSDYCNSANDTSRTKKKQNRVKLLEGNEAECKEEYNEKETNNEIGEINQMESSNNNIINSIANTTSCIDDAMGSTHFQPLHISATLPVRRITPPTAITSSTNKQTINLRELSLLQSEKKFKTERLNCLVVGNKSKDFNTNYRVNRNARSKLDSKSYENYNQNSDDIKNNSNQILNRSQQQQQPEQKQKLQQQQQQQKQQEQIQQQKQQIQLKQQPLSIQEKREQYLMPNRSREILLSGSPTWKLQENCSDGNIHNNNGNNSSTFNSILNSIFSPIPTIPPVEVQKQSDRPLSYSKNQKCTIITGRKIFISKKLNESLQQQKID